MRMMSYRRLSLGTHQMMMTLMMTSLMTMRRMTGTTVLVVRMVLLEAVPAVVVLPEAAVAVAGVLVEARVVDLREVAEILSRPGSRGVLGNLSRSTVLVCWLPAEQMALPSPSSVSSSRGTPRRLESALMLQNGWRQRSRGGGAPARGCRGAAA
jgi:hypothetical protein